MRKLIVLTAVTSILLVGSQQQAWAGNKAQQKNDDYRTFKKIVRVLDAVINDGHSGKGKNYVYVRTYHYPKKTCYSRGRRKVCYLKQHGRGCQQCGNEHQYKQYSKKSDHGRDDYRGRNDYR